MYLKITLQEYRKTRAINRLVTAIGWLPISKGRDMWQESRYSMIDIASSLQSSYEHFIERAKAQMIVDLMAAGIIQEEARVQARNYFGSQAQISSNTHIFLGKYQRPPMIPKDISTLKIYLFDLGTLIGIPHNNKDIDNAYTFCREVYFHFGRLHIKQSIEGADGGGDASGLAKVYARLATQAADERPLEGKSNRFAQPNVFPSRIVPPSSRCANMWRVVGDKSEEEIYATIVTAIDERIDPLLQNEQRYLEINDLEKIEETLERLSAQFVEANLQHTEKTRLVQDPAMDKADLRPLDYLYNSPREKPPRRISWKHVVKAYLIERLLVMREYQRKISYAFNYFSSVKKRINEDIVQLGLKTFKNSDVSVLRMVYIAEDEIRLVNANGEYIFLEESLAEYRKAITRLLQCGTYYISQYEKQIGSLYTTTKHVVDRGLVLFDLLKEECKFQYAKVEITRKLVYVYEHTADYAQTQAVGQLIHEFIERRPKLQLVGDYFQGAYRMEHQCLKKYAEFLDQLIINQIREELKVNENCSNVKQKKDDLHYEEAARQQHNKVLFQSANSKGAATKPELHDPYIGREGEPYTKKLEEILELEPMQEDDLFLSHQNLVRQEGQDKELESLYLFASHEEGQTITLNDPCLPYEGQSDASLPPCNLCRVYSSLGEVVRAVLAVRYATKAMAEDYQAESGLAIAALEAEVIKEAMKVCEELVDFAASPPSAVDREVKSMETAAVADSAEVLVHTVKELASALNCDNPYEIDPVLLARLAPSKLDDLDIKRFAKNELPNSPKRKKISSRDWPSLLTFMCNIAEFIKLREHLLSTFYEANTLTEIYSTQKDLVSNNSQLLMNEPVLASKLAGPSYVDPLVCGECSLKLPVREFDPSLQHLLCFHSAKCVKLIVVFGAM